MQQFARHMLVIGLVAGTVLFGGLGKARLWDRDEPRNAGAAVEMLERQDWVTPYFNAEQRQAKPVLLYWLIMSAYAVFGVNEFAARFWSAALGCGTVMLTYALGRRLFSASVALWSAVILATTLMFDVAARAATPDSTLIFFCTAGLVWFAHLLFARPEALPAGGRGDTGGLRDTACQPAVLSQGQAMILYGLLGGAVLAKGPVGLVLPVAVAGMFLLIVRLPEARGSSPLDVAPGGWQRVWRRTAACGRVEAPKHFLCTCLAMRPLTAVVTCLAVAAPWYIWVGLRTDGEWLRGFFWKENLGRALQPLENHHGSIFYYPLALCVGFFPWSVFFAPLVLETAARLRGRQERPAIVFLWSWVGVYIGLFSLAQTKLPSYITPMYPALAVLMGRFIAAWTEGESRVARWWPKVALGVYLAVGVALVVSIPVLARRFLPGEEWLGAIGLIPFAGGIIGLAGRSSRRAAMAFGLSAAAFTGVLFVVATARVDRHQQVHRLLSLVENRGTEARLASFGCLEPSWVFYGKRPIRELSRPLPPGSSQPALSVAEHLSGPGPAYLIVPDAQLPAIQHEIPEDCEVLASVPYFLKPEKLLLIGPVNSTRTARR